MTSDAIEDTVRLVVEGVMTLVAALLGLVGNTCALWVFSKQKDLKVVHRLLLQLAIFDMVMININRQKKC